MRSIKLANITLGGRKHPFFIVGPCVIESAEHTVEIARKLVELFRSIGQGFIFKASYDKANRTSITSFRGPGLKEGIRILGDIRSSLQIPILTDVHEPSQVEIAARVADVLQVPAFLSRQTDLILEVGRSGKIVNVKKGQFLAPWDMANVIEKILSTGNDKIILTERGFSLGYNNLVVDFRSFSIMRKLGFPIVFDATHSVQTPGGAGKVSGGNAEFIVPLAKAAAAYGVDGLFFEVHDNPVQALCDGPNSLEISMFKNLVERLLHICSVSSEGSSDES